MTVEQLQYQVIRSSRKTVAIQILPSGQVVLRCPRRMSAARIQSFVESKRDWIQAHLERIAAEPAVQPFLPEDLERMKQAAKADLSARAERFSRQLGLEYGRVTVRAQRSRWGSCSAGGNLSFNCLLMEAPEPVRDYVVVHELCHRAHMDHSAAFWAAVGQALPDYGKSRQWLKQNGGRLIARLPEKK